MSSDDEHPKNINREKRVNNCKSFMVIDNKFALLQLQMREANIYLNIFFSYLLLKKLIVKGKID